MDTKKKYALFVWLLVAYEIAIYLSVDAYAPALPGIAKAFGVTASSAQFTAIAWFLGGFIVQLIFGPLSDRFGRRPILLFGGVLYVLSSIGCALSPNIHTLLIFRFLQGVAMPSMYIPGYAAINELFSTQEAVHKMAIMNAVTILAPAFGPILGGAFLLVAGWQWIFVVLAVIATIVVTWLFFVMPETVSEEEKQKHTIHLPRIVCQYGKVMGNFKFMNSALLTFLPIVGLISWMLAGPFIITEIFHHSTLDFGIIQVFVFGGFIIGTKVVKKIANDQNYQSVVNLGLGLGLVGSVLLFFISCYFPHALVLVVITLMMVTFGSGLSIPVLSRLTLEKSDETMGVKVTVFSVVRIGAGVLGSVSLALVYNKTLLSMTAIILLFYVISIVLRLVDCFGERKIAS
jgi:Bcr/CflA subfamily drug resistance transporter